MSQYSFKLGFAKDNDLSVGINLYRSFIKIGATVAINCNFTTKLGELHTAGFKLKNKCSQISVGNSKNGCNYSSAWRGGVREGLLDKYTSITEFTNGSWFKLVALLACEEQINLEETVHHASLSQ